MLGTVSGTSILQRFRHILKFSIEITNMYIYDFGPKAMLSNAVLKLTLFLTMVRAS